MQLFQAGHEGQNQVRVPGLTKQENELMLPMPGLRPHGCCVIKEKKQTPREFIKHQESLARAGEAAQTRILGKLRQDNSIIQPHMGQGIER